VGPIYRDGKHGEPELLASAYRRALELAAENYLSSIAFPAISTGVYGYPVEDAARIAFTTMLEFSRTHDMPKAVRMVLFSSDVLAVHKRVLAELTANDGK
jgi:O-acetyl-ADP-ribose deacetylase (regulator of RNase III)